MNLKKLLADALFLDARVYHYRSCGYDEASAYALASQDLAEQQRASAASAAEMERLEKSREHYRESMAALEERRRKLSEENPWIYEEAEKFRQEAVRKPPGSAKKQERRTVNLSLLRWYAYFPPYGFGLFCSHRIYSHRIKRSPIRKGRVSLDKAAQQKREDDPSSRFQHIDLLISSYISRVPRWKGPSPCRSRCGQSFRGA